DSIFPSLGSITTKAYGNKKKAFSLSCAQGAEWDSRLRSQGSDSCIIQGSPYLSERWAWGADGSSAGSHACVKVPGAVEQSVGCRSLPLQFAGVFVEDQRPAVGGRWSYRHVLRM